VEEKIGSFVIHNGGKNKQKGNYSSPDRENAREELVMYKEVESICTSLTKGSNYVEFILPNDKQKKSHLTRRIPVRDIYKILPAYFIQINQSEIINIFHIKRRSNKYLFTKLNTYRIADDFYIKVKELLETFFHTSQVKK
jgi:hypothetical protein